MAYWYREYPSLHIEARICILIEHYLCPACNWEASFIWGWRGYEPDSDLPRYNSNHDLFLHFKAEHYSQEAMIKYAKRLIYERIGAFLTHDEDSFCRRQALELDNNFEQFLYESRLTWFERLTKIKIDPPDELIQRVIDKYFSRKSDRINKTFGIIQDCVIFESVYNKRSKFAADRRASALYHLSKSYLLPDKLIQKLLHTGHSLPMIRKIVTQGMMLNYGNKDENLPEWMQKVLKYNIIEEESKKVI